MPVKYAFVKFYLHRERFHKRKKFNYSNHVMLYSKSPLDSEMILKSFKVNEETQVRTTCTNEIFPTMTVCLPISFQSAGRERKTVASKMQETLHNDRSATCQSFATFGAKFKCQLISHT